eukprot:12412532-Karenia_brevis.AAC.1
MLEAKLKCARNGDPAMKAVRSRIRGTQPQAAGGRLGTPCLCRTRDHSHAFLRTGPARPATNCNRALSRRAPGLEHSIRLGRAPCPGLSPSFAW